jgi:hypothetical protein
MASRVRTLTFRYAPSCLRISSRSGEHLVISEPVGPTRQSFRTGSSAFKCLASFSQREHGGHDWTRSWLILRRGGVIFTTAGTRNFFDCDQFFHEYLLRSCSTQGGKLRDQSQ